MCIKRGLGISSSYDVSSDDKYTSLEVVYGLTTDKTIFDYQHRQEIFLFIQTS
jgi:hypothetical protein